MEEYKDIVLNIDVTTLKKECIRTNKEFFSYDKQSARIIINITKNSQPIRADSIKAINLFMASSDRYGRIIEGMQYQTDIKDVNDGEAIHVLPDEYLNYSGPAVIHVYIDFLNGPTNDAGQSFLIDFQKSAIDQVDTENVLPNYFKRFDDIVSEVQYVADKKMEEINNLGIDIGSLVEDYLSNSSNIATKEYVETKANVSDQVLMAWLYLETEGEN